MSINIPFEKDEYQAMMRALIIYEDRGEWPVAVRRIRSLVERLKPYESMFDD